MKFYKKWSVLGTALLIMLLFALPAFAQWQSTPVQSVTFRETVPQNAIVVDTNYVYVAAHDGHRLVVYRWDLGTAEKLDAVWLIEGNLVSGVAGAYPSMALYSYDDYKYVLLSYIANGKLKVALFDPDDETWYIKEVPCADLRSPQYTSIAVGYANSAFDGGATVAAIAVGGDSGVYLATVNMGAVGSATEAQFKSNLNWEVSRITDKKATGVDVFLLPQNAGLSKWDGLIYVSYIAGEYGQSGTGLYLAVSKNGKDWSGTNGCVALVDADPNVVYGADTSLWVGPATMGTSAAIGIAYVTKGGKLLFTSFATETTWDIIAELPQVAQSEFLKNEVVSSNVKPCNIDMGVSGLATGATIAIAYFDTRTGSNEKGAWVAYATNAVLGSSITPWKQKQVDANGYGAITLISGVDSYYYYSWATTGDLLKLATAAASDLEGWTPNGGRTLANASLFGMGYSVAGTGDYHASFYDAVLRTLNYLKFDSSYTIKDDATTKIVDKYGWFKEAGDAIAVKVPQYLDAGWNTDIDLDSKGEPHIVFTSILGDSASSLDTAINPATPATVSYVTTTVGGWVNPETVATDLNVRDLDIEITSVGDMKDALHVTWVNAFTSNKGVFYRQKKGTDWQTIRQVYNLPTEVVDGNLDMKVLVLSNGDELIGLAVGLATSSASSVHYAWKKASEQTFPHVFEVEKFDGYNKMCEVALALYNDKATVVYTAPGGRGALSYETDVANVSVDNGWKGRATEIDDGGCPLCERKDPFVVVDGSDVYVLYKYLDYPTTTKYYFRFGKITEEPDYVKVGTDKVESNPVFANASRMEALMTKSLFFYKGTTGIANAAESEVPPAPEVSVSVNPPSLDFGEVNVGESKELTVTVTVDNPTASAVSVSVTAPTGFTVTPESWTVDAGKTGDTKTLTVTFAPTEAKDYSGTLTVTVGTKTATVSLSGAGKSVGGGGGCSASDVGSLGLALLLIGPAILALRRK